MLYARALQGVNMRDLIGNISACASAAPSDGGPAQTGSGGAGDAGAEQKQEVAKEPEPDSGSEDDMGFGLFD